MSSSYDEVLSLLNFRSERPLTGREEERLSELLSSDESLIDVYVDYMSIQSLLMWNAGSFPSAVTRAELQVSTITKSDSGRSRPTSNRSLVAVAVVLVTLLAARNFVATSGPGETTVTETETRPDQDGATVVDEFPTVAPADIFGTLTPLHLENHRDTQKTSQGSETVAQTDPTTNETESTPRVSLPENFDDALISERIDQFITAGLKENTLEPSPPASDTEWLRRVYLTVAGRIPTVAESQPFLENRSPRKRGTALDHVLNLPDRSRNLAVIWTNLLVGRTPRKHVNRDGLFEFLHASFSENRPWIDTVGDLITARGRSDENGATNFLLAHLNNQATPATAVTSRLFLGEQISCVQCHDHPFSSEMRQEDYWALNAFFKDTQKTSVAVKTGADSPNTMKSAAKVWQLVDRQRGDRMTYYENRKGEQRAILPQFAGYSLDRESDENRRDRLASLLAADSDSKVARAMVNRVWSHFFGYGFTPDVDDMGAHVPVSHPELLDLLTEAFVQSDYDLKRLMKWIGGSQSWQRSSQMIAGNEADRPDHGSLAMFSRVYVQRMTPEQVYESVRTAIRSSAGIRVDTDDGGAAEAHRREWVAQFAQSYNTDENDESMDFDGSIAQAMVMMNNAEVSQAIKEATQAMLGEVGASKSVTSMLKKITLAMLTRQPTAGEQKLFQSHYRRLAMNAPPSVAMPNAVQDMMWVYLNTSEFVLVY